MPLSPIHQASQVSPSLHSPALMELVDLKISRPVIDYVVDCVSETVDYALGRPSTSSRGRSSVKRDTSFTNFVSKVLTNAEVTMPTLLVSLAYIDRVKPHLNIALEQWALERVFLGALIVASKYLNDSTLKNVHWALCTGVFGKRDVGRIEREFLDVLEFELGITEDALLIHHDGLAAALLPSHAVRSSHAPYEIPRRHHHHSRHHLSPRSTVPELQPCSPHSSAGSSSPSPRTPFSSSVSPLDSGNIHHPHHKSSSASLPPKPIDSSSSHFDQLLRAFPIPVSSTAAAPSRPSTQFHPRSSSSSHMQYPIQVVA